jgi:hypothetical protein
MRLRFTIRDLLWLTVVVANACQLPHQYMTVLLKNHDANSVQLRVESRTMKATS